MMDFIAEYLQTGAQRAPNVFNEDDFRAMRIAPGYGLWWRVVQRFSKGIFAKESSP